MPFINITFQEAKNCLKDRKTIVELLKIKKINPKEADLMNHLHLYAQGDQIDTIDKVKNLCVEYFPSNHEEAFQKLNRFVISDNKRVSWVIFSRTFQSIPYDEKDPLYDYTPRISEVLTIRSTFKVIK